MRLCLDIGNTHLFGGVFSEKKLTLKFRHSTQMNCSSDQLGLFLKVQFVHKLDDRNRQLLLDDADLFVMPSRELETFGLTIIEALNQGVPVIGTPVGAIPEILQKFDKRFICEATSSQAIFEKIKWYMSLPVKQRNIFRKKAVTTIQKYFSSKIYEKDLENVYGI